jgi:CheY-like chemotaxis protein
MTSILYVDDDADDQEIFCEAVKSINPKIACLVAGDGMEALSLLEELVIKPDFIFLDLNMPVFNGKQFLQHLRKNHRYDDIHVIMYSTTANPTEAMECMKLGAIDFIVKPSSFKEVYDKLRRVIPAL